MTSFKVKATKLNVRTGPVENFADKGNVIAKLLKDAPFESVNEKTNRLGQWLQDVNGHWAWGGGMESIKPSFKWFQDLGIENIWSSFNILGDGCTIAVLDSGYDIHNQDLPTPISTKLFVDNPSHTATIQDNIGHGTFCTSIVSTKGQKFRLGIAPLSKILIGKVSLQGELDDVNLILNGIEWAINEGADIISISFGLPLTDETQINSLQLRLNQIVEGKNVLIFAACGDSRSGQIIAKEFYPASLTTCISVGTVNNNQLDNITIRSEKTILHTLGIDLEGYILNNIIEKESGTSVSTPIIAGIAALAVSFLKQKNNGKWSKDNLLEKLIATGDPLMSFDNKKIINPIRLFQSL